MITHLYRNATEALPIRREEDDIPRTRATRVHPIAENEIQPRPMPEPSQSMGPALQRESEATHHHSQLAPSFLANDICGHLSTGATTYRQPLSIRCPISTTHFFSFRFVYQIDYDDGIDAGFKVSNTSCCKVEAKLGGLCLPNSKLCENRNDYVFWDAFHPSDAANVVLANHFFNIMFPNSTASTPLPSH